MLIGRAVSGVYNKVMNYRAIDPRDARAGLLGSGAMDRRVWARFFDATSGELRQSELDAEFNRYWGTAEGRLMDEGEATAVVDRQTISLLRLPLSQLLRRYEDQGASRPSIPPTLAAQTRQYERSPLVVAIGKKRADFRCEVEGCSSPTFVGEDGYPYCEVHHLTRLADGGADTIENVACLCAVHHREAHHGKNASVITASLRRLRDLVS
jgi:hypothetical protein